MIVDNGMSVNGEEFFVMERLGVSLVDILKRNKLKFSYQQTIALGVQLIQALEKFHDLGYVHCDLKPDNILFGLPSKQKPTGMLSKAKKLSSQINIKKAMASNKPLTNDQFQAYIIDYGLSHNIFKKLAGQERQHVENQVVSEPFYHFKGNMLFSSKHGFMG